MAPTPVGFRFRPTKTTLHRYDAHELRGPLPAVLYKVLPRVYAERLVGEGEMMWSTLRWFQNEEHPDRGDEFEGTHRHFPEDGLRLTRREHLGRPDSTAMLLPDEGIHSAARKAHHIFIYSMTLDQTVSIGDDPTMVRVEIFDPQKLIELLSKTLQRHPKARASTLIYDTVDYWSTTDEIGPTYALPHLITMRKQKRFEGQREYRFAFGIRANVFDFENVDYQTRHKDYRDVRERLDPQRHRLKLRLGPLQDCCRLLETERVS